MNFNNYNLEKYQSDIQQYGLTNVWDNILNYLLPIENNNINFLNISNLSMLYEFGLTIENKLEKKEFGKYYTPLDVSLLMSEWFDQLKGENICDVCCGTGNLILSYFSYIGEIRTKEILEHGKVYLYDIDKLALKICQYSIAIKYGKEYLSSIHIIQGDFLSKEICLPKNCKVISNPPYYKIKNIPNNWDNTIIQRETKEFYSAIMEKILEESVSSIIITPYSFLGGSKFLKLREMMNEHNGKIISFDNVPGNIFNGKKHGCFNSNNSNSVRTSITITENKPNIYGYQISPLIRFKNDERDKLLNCNLLDNLVSTNYQIITKTNTKYCKCFKELSDMVSTWQLISGKTLNHILSNKKTEYLLCIPNTCRYYTVASITDLTRTGKHILYFNSLENRNLTYCFLNSSFGYLWWRLFDGGITYPLSLLKTLPIFFDKISENDKQKLFAIQKEMLNNQKKFMIYKKNAGKIQENIKYPNIYREQLNEIFCKYLNIDYQQLETIHKNSFFKEQ